MTSSESDTDTSTLSILSIDSKDYEDLSDLVSLSSLDSSSYSSDLDNTSSDDSIENYGFIKSENVKKNLLRCYNCLKIFNS